LKTKDKNTAVIAGLKYCCHCGLDPQSSVQGTAVIAGLTRNPLKNGDSDFRQNDKKETMRHKPLLSLIASN
jgi:hypothetical protein